MKHSLIWTVLSHTRKDRKWTTSSFGNKWKSLFTAGNELNDQYDDDDECHLQRSSSVPETYANQRIPNCGNFQQSDVEIEKQRIKPSSSNKEDCTNTSYLCDERDGSFTPELSPPLRKIVHNYMEYARDNCNEAFLTTRESEKHPCEILQTNHNANEKPTLVIIKHRTTTGNKYRINWRRGQPPLGRGARHSPQEF